MNSYERYNSFSVPQMLLEKQEGLSLSDAEVLALVKVLSTKQKIIPITVVISDLKIQRDDLARLCDLNLLSMTQEQGEIYVSVVVLFETLFEGSTPVQNVVVQSNQELTAEVLDRISFLLNRKIKNFELEMLKEWTQEGYKVEEIEVAIQKSVINNADNFNYIQAVLQNDVKKETDIDVKVERNIEFY